MRGVLVNVIVPAYNAENHIISALKSILDQTEDRLEVIVIDDGSTDGTLNTILNFRKNSLKFSVITQPNKGQTIAKNKGLQAAKGSLIAFLDSDDKWHPRKIEKQLHLMNSHPEVGMCYTRACKIDEFDNPFDFINPSPFLRGNCFHHLVLRNNIVASSVMVRRSVLEDVGLYDQNLPAAENWDLWIRISKKYKIDYIDEPLTFYRIHPKNMSKDFERMYKARMYLINKHLPPNSDDPWIKNARKQALFYAHKSFAKNYLEAYHFSRARKELLMAMSIDPTDRESYHLLLKTLLGRRLFSLLRKIKHTF